MSFDGPDCVSHEAIRGKNTFASTHAGLRRLVVSSRRADTHCIVGISATVNKFNFDNLGSFIDFAEGEAVESIVFSELHDGGRAGINWPAISLSEEELRFAAIDLAHKLKSGIFKGSARVDFFTRKFLDLIHDETGYEPHPEVAFDSTTLTECYIQHDGKMFPSQQLSEMKPENLHSLLSKLGITPVDNDLRSKDFRDIWLGADFSKLRRFIYSRGYWSDYSGCSACRHFGQTCDPGFSRWARNQAVPHSLCA